MCPLPANETDYYLESSEYFNATSSYISAVNETFFDIATENIATLLNVYYTPLLVALGCIGNLLSVFVFYRTKLRLQSTSQYLTALALSDTVFLFQLIPPWLNAVEVTGLFYKHGFCQIFVYVTYVSCCMSSWLVVAFTVERFVAVLYPLRRNALCTVTRARHIIFTVLLASSLINLPVLRFAVPSKNDCNIDFEYLDQAARFNLVDTALSFSVPLFLITILNTWIMIGVWKLERQRRQIMKEEMERARARPYRTTGCPRSQHRVTRMLLIVSSVFVVLNLPAYTMRILAYAYNMNEEEYSGRWAAVQQLSLLFFNTNFGINFMLYCLSGQNFRRAVQQTLPCLRKRADHRAARRATQTRPGSGSSK
ncbi:neuropeptide receptor A18 [Bombyx mori]|uniref:Neuropeptide receptor A18 n=1 Tax=Bombyx mori TaxID=7091 RepID=B3XXN1_BOMMO|nr:neuropeptide receptor A18 [Bombyx mori]BAG68417.1 neuropeptide receptor A18 [Bombyx mori]